MDDFWSRHAWGSLMNLFQHADYTILQRDLKAAQSRCQTRRIHQIQRRLKAVVTDILRDETGAIVVVKNQAGHSRANDMKGTR
jgi:hypothetical protein